MRENVCAHDQLVAMQNVSAKKNCNHIISRNKNSFRKWQADRSGMCGGEGAESHSFSHSGQCALDGLDIQSKLDGLVCPSVGLLLVADVKRRSNGRGTRKHRPSALLLFIN